jgi:hypothetical protein
MLTANEIQLRQIREGDRLKYHGVQWQVIDHSTYQESAEYSTEEWLLKSRLGKEYYLLYEIDTNEAGDLVQAWYIAEQLRQPAIYEPRSGENLTVWLPQVMLSHQTPYPQLQALSRLYQFESVTEGDYQSDDTTQHRIIWDYWDAPHLWNLALEVWRDGRLDVYSTRRVQPSDFSDIQESAIASSTYFAPSDLQEIPQFSNGSQTLVAFLLIGVGFILMLVGI